MSAIKKIQNIGISFAVDNNYAPYLSTTIKSLLCNRNRSLGYDILILCSGLSQKNQDLIRQASQAEEGVTIRFVDVTKEAEALRYDVDSYLTIATNYRLLLFSDLFLEYDRMIYLDSDVIVESDISELYNVNLEDTLIAAVPETSVLQLSYCKKAVFIDGKYPYNIDNYRTDALAMKYPNNYFNAGVFLVDLKKCRDNFKYSDVLTILRSKHYFFNDQDVLNILFDGKVHILDYVWNYQNNVEVYCKMRPNLYCEMYKEIRRTSPKIIHYVSSHKPWNESVELDEYFKKYI